MLVLDYNKVFTNQDMAHIVETLVQAKCLTVVIPYTSTLASRPSLGARLEAHGIRVVAARQSAPDTLCLARMQQEMAYVLGLDTTHVGPVLTKDTERGGWRTPLGRFLPSWNPADPLPDLPADVVLPDALMSWTGAYLVAAPFDSDELNVLVEQIPAQMPDGVAPEQIEGELALLTRNPTQTRIVADAARIVSVLHEISEYSTGIGRGSAFASQLCYALGINRIAPTGLTPDKFYDNLDRVPDVDINISQRHRTTYLERLTEEHGAHRLVVVDNEGKVSPHPSALTLRTLMPSPGEIYSITSTDAKVMQLPIVDLLSSRVVDQYWDLTRLCGAVDSVPDGVWNIFATGNTYGLPELGTSLGQRLSARLKPQSLEDVERLVALVRPGVQSNHLNANNWRRAIVFQDEARDRLVEDGVDPATARTIVNTITKKQDLDPNLPIPESAQPVVTQLVRAGYLAPREHAQAYARQIIHLATYRYLYPDRYIDYMIDYVTDKTQLLEQVAKPLKLEIVEPRINSSPEASHVHGGRLYLGLGTLVGSARAQEIVRVSQKIPFAKDPRDFRRRMGYDAPCAIGC
jgi:hypothetical protein